MGLEAEIWAWRLGFETQGWDLNLEGGTYVGGGKGLVAKALDGQRYLLPLCEFMWMCGGERGSGPEGANDLCLVSFEALGLNLSINNGI